MGEGKWERQCDLKGNGYIDNEEQHGDGITEGYVPKQMWIELRWNTLVGRDQLAKGPVSVLYDSWTMSEDWQMITAV